jgi:hypothetical protein
MTTTTPPAADINKLEQILQLPAIKQAFDAATQAEEDAAAAARADVLAQIGEAETALDAQKEITLGLAAEIGHARQHLDELLQRNQAHAEEVKASARRLTDLGRTLNREHGGNMITEVVRQLKARETALRDQAERLQALHKPGHNRFGELHLTPDTDAHAQAADKLALADKYAAAWRDIEYLERLPISPAEIRRRIEQAVVGLGMKAVEAAQQEGWRIEGWSAGKSRTLPSIQAA